VSDVPASLEPYLDTVPRAWATAREVGPFTLFLRDDPAGWHYYARPRLGGTHAWTREDVDGVRAAQRELGVPESLEWVHETTPGLLDAARESGLAVELCPLLVLGERVPAPDPALEVRVLGPDDDLAAVEAAVHAGFGGSDEPVPVPLGDRVERVRSGLFVLAGAYDERGTAVGGGSHGPRGEVTELTGIAVLPRARRRGFGAALAGALVTDAHARGVRTVFLSAEDDAVARVYERVGFVRVGTSCIAAPPT
jgi:ribosomal protein S18 acetylase RimI-like enzyme